MKGELVRTTIAALCVVTAAAAAAAAAAENRYVDRRHRATDTNRANAEEAARWKRAYAAPWNGEHSEYQTFTKFSLWKPSMYQINGAYYIPVLGEQGKVPMYFAPQPFNPSSMFPSKRKPFVGPPYLPPHTTASPPPGETTTMKVVSRFEFDDDDDRPVWNAIDREPEAVATRPPPPPLPAQPPLLHRPGPDVVQLSAQDEEAIKEIFGDDAVSTRAPSPPLRGSTEPPPPPPARRPSGPSNCVWAVVSCCSAATSVYPELCFEQRGCPGPFWGASPCDTEFAKAAVEAALKFYNP